MNVEEEVVITNKSIAPLRSTYLKDLIGIFLLGVVVGAGGLLNGFG
jgi:hypothetical protein